MIAREAIPNLLGNTAYDGSHDRIGTIGHVYVDDRTGEPEWMTVQTGKFGSRESFVPLEPAELRGSEVVVPFSKDQISNAPNVDPVSAGHLSEQDEAKMCEFYGLAQPSMPSGTHMPRPDDAMVRSEERMHVGQERVESGRVHLRKYVVTEEQQQTVPVRKEKVHLEREPITDRGRGMSSEMSDDDREVVRHEERPVMNKETVPVERVRLATDEITQDEPVSGQVRKERIDADGLRDDEGR
ncbi:DUF2382 domain-containing protein [Rhizomonospora bruguierae]|uniref:DUF2382 domain-containing protein n=1 Tax=Rhizomonospora bruguierae TaxID=1581705 RepID=UPI001BD1A875|nr:PRC and DUF2382 domain-containing protein [Micromonospora sp. NBRC 107566]